VSLRPARVAVLINQSDHEWQETCLRVIEYFSTIWGGGHCIIIPTDGESIKEPFWQILEAFDPDHIYAYRKTLEDMEISRPADFSSICEREIKAWIEKTPGSERRTVEKPIYEQLRRVPAEKFGIGRSLQEEAGFRLAPLHFKERFIEEGRVGANSEAHYPLTSLRKILSFCERPNEIVELQVKDPHIPQLWHAATTGHFRTSYRQELEKQGLRFAARAVTEEGGGELISLLVGDMVEFATPFSLSMMALDYRISFSFHNWDEPVVIVVGETVEDFCLYFALSRIRQDVYWLLPAWLMQFQSGQERAKAGGDNLSGAGLYPMYFAFALLKRARAGQADRKIVVLSGSAGSSQIQRWSDLLDEAASLGGSYLSDRIEQRDSLVGLLNWPLRVFGRQNCARDSSHQFLGVEMAVPLESPKPKGFSKVDPYEHRWMTEFTIKDHLLPKHSALGDFVVRHPAVHGYGSRSGASGVAYFCPNAAVFSPDIDMVLIKPSIWIPDALEVFQHLAREAKMDCRISDKGYFLAETIRKFSDLAKLGAFLRQSQNRALLDKFLDTKEVAPDVTDEGVYLKSDRRRYLDFQSIRKVLGASDSEVGATIDTLVGNGVLYRGFVFKCSFCRNADWFSVDDITHKFQCKRCNYSQTYIARHLLGRSEPTWFYKLDEIVYQGYLNNMTVPSLALYSLYRAKRQSFLYSTELEFYESSSGKLTGEADICCIVDGLLSVGEAKKNNRLGDNAIEDGKIARKYLSLAKTLGARNVIFATIAPEWSQRTLTEVKSAFGDTMISHTMLRAADLL
jgi:hypothetical protein